MTRVARAALVGAGRIAELHAIAIRAAGVELHGVVSSSPEKSRDAAARLGATRAYDSFEELLADADVGVVHVTSPTGLHVEHVSRLVESGKHVICEKPLAVDIESASKLVALADAAQIIGTVAFTYRYHPVVQAMRARVRAGELGTLTGIQGSYLQDWLLTALVDEWRLDPVRGGRSRAFADIGSHLVDLIEFVTGDRIAELSARTKQVVPGKTALANSADDVIAATVATASGAIGSLFVSQVAPGHVNSLALEVNGTEGSLRVDLEHPLDLWTGKIGASSVLGADVWQDAIVGSGFQPQGDMRDFVGAFSAFVDDSYALMAGDDRDGVPTFVDGLRAVTLSQTIAGNRDLTSGTVPRSTSLRDFHRVEPEPSRDSFASPA